MERDDLALDGLLRELGRASGGDEAFVRRVLSRAEPRPSQRALFFIAAAGLFAALGFLLEPTPTARLGFTRQACLVPEAKTMRVLAKDGRRYLLLGDVPVDAQARVPAETPIVIQAVGADGMALWTDRDEVRLRIREVRSPSAGPLVALDKKAARTLDYGRDVKPILDQHCVGCHAESDLLATVKPFDARHSALVTQNHGAIPPADRRQIALWVDLGAARP
ncbi:MAG TPA: hypothetical protein VKW04_08965 [Planctomycetota bacterium]|nr:hypothetical protein [Planctomycetota bacterium]